jgi:selenocysteine lyase/cysteine desulfurase
LPTSHGFIPAGTTEINNPLPLSKNSTFVNNFEFVGTVDSSNYLCIPTAIKWRNEVAGGEGRIIEYCHSLAQKGGQRVAEILGTEVMDNSTHTLTQCCMVNVRLPVTVLNSTERGDEEQINVQEGNVPALQAWMCKQQVAEFNTFIPVIYHGRKVWARFSAQTYLEVADFEWGADVLKGLCERARKEEYLSTVKESSDSGKVEACKAGQS